uniref:Glyco_18 domain-containing protein n=1 Tax=Caenorhabditis tropicalis TaxID=1561998 RepID=A0A1I7UCG4_9PELO
MEQPAVPRRPPHVSRNNRLETRHLSALSPLPPASKCGKRIVGYYTEWEPMKMKPRQLKKLTHLIFQHIPMNATGHVNYQDSAQRRRLTEMRKMAKSENGKVKVMFSIGGHLNSEYLSGIIADLDIRKKFINSIINFIKINQLDGVDLFWNWPTSSDMDSFVDLVRELRGNLTEAAITESRKDHYLLSLVAPPTPSDYEQYFDLEKFLDHVDFVNVMVSTTMLRGDHGNVDGTMRFLICKYKRPSKLNMAVSFYGRYWKRVNTNDTDEMWKTAELTDGVAEGSFLTWRYLKKNGWTSEAVWHEETRTPFVWRPKERIFFVFENEQSLKEKMDYVTDNNLGGIYIWALGADDDEDTLLDTVSSVDLCEGGSGDTINYMCDNASINLK